MLPRVLVLGALLALAAPALAVEVPDMPLAALPDLDPPVPVPGATMPCAATDATEGDGDAVLPTMTWAALKTGFRLAVVWRSAEASPSSLDIRLPDGSVVRADDETSRHVHAYVLDGFPVGSLVCFRGRDASGEGEVHAVRMANAMHARGPGGAYSLNLLVLATEGATQVDLVEASHAEAARRWTDATDGHLAFGRVITLVGDVRNHDSGIAACAIPFLAVEGRVPSCDRVFDVLWTYDMYPHLAAGTNRDAVANRHGSIWMHNAWELLLPAGDPEEAGGTLAHELGHYVLGQTDLYQGDGCADPRWRISLMDDSRTATELDDEVARCPTDPVEDYVPTWTLLRARFPDVPDRPAGPTEGPEGVGSAFRASTFVERPVAQVDPLVTPFGLLE